MENKKLLSISISIIILAVSIVFGSIWIGYSLQKIMKVQVSKTQVSDTQLLNEKALMTENESAEYLNISIDQFKDILSKDSQEKVKEASYDTYKFVPYMTINNGNKMFSKKELDEWIKYNTFNK